MMDVNFFVKGSITLVFLLINFHKLLLSYWVLLCYAQAFSKIFRILHHFPPSLTPWTLSTQATLNFFSFSIKPCFFIIKRALHCLSHCLKCLSAPARSAALPLILPVTLGKCQNLSLPQIPKFKARDKNEAVSVLYITSFVSFF